MTRDLGGRAGLALMFHALDQAGDGGGFFDAGRRELTLAIEDPSHGVGMFDGYAGLRAALALIARREREYAPLVDACDVRVERRLPIDAQEPGGPEVFDLTHGWAGIRLSRGVLGTYGADRLSERLLGVLEGQRWLQTYGMAHGLAGVIASLALTVGQLSEVTRVSISSGAAALAASFVERDGIRLWPPVRGQAQLSAHRSAWCCGTPGVAAALAWAGQRLDDRELTGFAVDALLRLGRRPSSTAHLFGTGICHGLMGSALVYATVARATGVEELAAIAKRQTYEVLSELEFTHYECYARNTQREIVSSAGLLDGSSGVALGLLTLAGDFDGAWLRCLGLAAL